MPFSSVLEQVRAFDKAGLRYRFTAYPAADHLAWSLQDDWSAEINHLGHPVVMHNPGSIHYAWYPDGSAASLGLGPTGVYWLRGLVARTHAPGQLASVDAASGERQYPSHVVTKTHEAVLPGDPLPGTATISKWRSVAPAPAARATLRLTLHDISSVTVDLVRAGFTPGQHVLGHRHDGRAGDGAVRHHGAAPAHRDVDVHRLA